MGYNKYTKELLEEAAQNSESIAGVMRYLGLQLAGGNHTHISKRLKDFDVDTSHFLGQGHQKGRPCNSNNKKSPDEILIEKSLGSFRTKPFQLRRALIEKGVPYICNVCNCEAMWNNKPLTLEVDHVNENWLDNTFENLQFLCPNCHSQK